MICKSGNLLNLNGEVASAESNSSELTILPGGISAGQVISYCSDDPFRKGASVLLCAKARIFHPRQRALNRPSVPRSVMAEKSRRNAR